MIKGMRKINIWMERYMDIIKMDDKLWFKIYLRFEEI